jgi:dual specificity MAP kinase phosphatase
MSGPAQPPVPIISGAEFAEKHLQHALAHPPDSVLFPFLHGLEGDNHAQNTFFASSNFAGASGTSSASGGRRYPDPNEGPRRLPPPPVPAYKGLVWVVCEDDLRAAGDTVSLSILRRRPMPQAPGEPIPTSSSDDDYEDDDDDDDDFMDEDEEEEHVFESADDNVLDERMEVDVDVLHAFRKDPDTKAPAADLDEDEQRMHRMVLQNVEHSEEMAAAIAATRSPESAARVLGMVSEANPPSSSPSPTPSEISPSSSQSSHSTSSLVTTSNTEATNTEDSSSNPSSPASTSSPASFLLCTPEMILDSQGDHVRIVHPGDSQEGEGVLDDNMPALGDRHEKEDMHHAGAHMHPVARRPVATLTSTVPVTVGNDNAYRLSIQTDLPLAVTPTPTPSETGLCIPDVAADDTPVHSPVAEKKHTRTNSDNKPNGAGKSPKSRPSLKRPTDPSAPPLLTSTFRPRELIRRVPRLTKTDDGSDLASSMHEKVSVSAEEVPSRDNVKSDNEDNWEFVPARVPDGISLRNFGIQVPIYATLSDVVIYSPYGATPSAMALAKRFQSAISAKRNERVCMRARFNAATGQEHEPQEPVDSSGLLNYNAYVLDASEEDLRKELPHLMMRIYGTGVPGGPGDGAHTDASNGHVIELNEDGRSTNQCPSGSGCCTTVSDGDGISNPDGMEVDSPTPDVGQPSCDILRTPNTVNFAVRERDEMRDLTKASEIITLQPTTSQISTFPPSNSTLSMSASSDISATSLPWDPRCGQVFLGNSMDVPLVQDASGQGQFKHAANSPPDSDEHARWDWHNLTRHLRKVDGLLAEYDAAIDETLDGPAPSAADIEERLQPLEDDPFNYVATNDPAEGFGYDICVECHDLAPFPSAAHLRAAEEHLAMLDTMWREKWEKAWYEREERRTRAEELESQRSSGSLSSEQARRSAAPVPPPPTPPRPPPHANSVIHLPFPSSPQNTQTTLLALLPIVRFLEQWVRPVQPLPIPKATTPEPPADQPSTTTNSGARRWSSVTSLLPSFASFPGTGNKTPNPPPTAPPSGAPPTPPRLRAMTSPVSHHGPHPLTPLQARTRPLKILMYSSDGYTESSVPALCLLMAIKGIMLPEAYLELQVEKRRSFFVYQSDIGVLKRVEARLREEREREKEKEREREREREKLASDAYMTSAAGAINANGKRTALPPAASRGGQWTGAGTPAATSSSQAPSPSRHGSFTGRPAAKSVSFAHPPPQFSQQQKSQPVAILSLQNAQPSASSTTPFTPGSLPSQVPSHPPAFSSSGTVHHPADTADASISPQQQATGMSVIKGRPRAMTSPWLPSLFGGDHQSWFNDPRFDGSFPSRVLPFLYLGNLNHASNAYMLHALGITHVVSVGECALIPPPHHMSGLNGGSSYYRPTPGTHFVPGKGPAGQGCLWIEEREGRIKVLDIKGVCDDGIDTLEPQLEPICDWIDKAREEGGQVLVHCRVGVSRSATVTIAYVMKHLGLPLVDAYLIVRSRRLSVLIQPNMRLLYNLCGWEIKLAKERAHGDQRRLKTELARTLTWPYLAKEVHALNEKYIH